MSETAFERYERERMAEETAFRAARNRGEYLESSENCHESCPGAGRCTREGKHYTHRATTGNGNVLGQWRIRRVIERVGPDVSVGYGE